MLNLFTADQLVLHLIGDYILQSDWMANNKTKAWWPAFVHATVYSLSFLLLTNKLMAWFIIYQTHYFIDRYRLARYLVWLKNWLGPNKPWKECTKTGYPNDKPDFMGIWLLIIADNILHIVINALVLKYV